MSVFPLFGRKEPPKRICHVQVLPLMSGVQRAMLEMFKHLDRDRYELHVACQGPGPLTDELQRQGIRWHAVPASTARSVRCAIGEPIVRCAICFARFASIWYTPIRRSRASSAGLPRGGRACQRSCTTFTPSHFTSTALG